MELNLTSGSAHDGSPNREVALVCDNTALNQMN